ncbi:MAG: holo-ACP synthase [Egibacteraceae bacterium]
MAVVGIGVDAVEIERMAAALARTPALLERLFTDRERADCRLRDGGWRVGGLAARFAAKEAVAKALGSGVRGFSFCDIEVCRQVGGRPVVVLHRGAADHAARLGVSRIHVSLSTSLRLAVANVLLESTGDA